MITDPGGSHNHIWVLAASVFGALAALLDEMREAGWECSWHACLRFLANSGIAVFTGWISGLLAAGSGLGLDMVAGLSGLGAFYSMQTLRLLADVVTVRVRRLTDGRRSTDEKDDGGGYDD